MQFVIIYIIIIVFCLYLLFFGYSYNKHSENQQIDNFFYDVNDVCPSLNNITPHSAQILNETLKVMDSKWYDWPELELYQRQGKWKIFPFFAFGIWEMENCNKCPAIYNFLKQIPNLKLATLSKLTAGMKLKPHRGWGNHSNNVIRCHYGLVVPQNCYISVIDDKNEKIMYHNKFKWLLFDDSKIHYAENKSNHDRIVLIIDVERPSHIKKGTSQVGDSKELLEVINYFKIKNKSI